MTFLRNIFRCKQRNFIVIALFLLLSLAAAQLLPPSPVWITDNGNKYMVMRNFAENGTLAIKNEVPGLFPCGGFHFIRSDSGIRSFHSEIFPLISSFFYLCGGDRAAPLWALLSTLGVLWLLGKTVDLRNSTVQWLLLTATPVWFYSLLLWEMTPGMFFAVCGLILLLKKREFAAGAAFGLGVWFREELYILGVIAGVMLLMQKRWRSLLFFSAGAVISALPLWIWNFFSTGHVLGFHGANYAVNNRPDESFSFIAELRGMLFNYHQHIFRFNTLGKFSPLLTVISLLLVIAGALRTTGAVRKIKIALLVLFLLVECAAVIGLYCADTALYTSAVTMGLVTSLPIAAGFFLNWRELIFSKSVKVAFISRFIAAAVVVIPPLLTRFDIGLTWGARHFIPLMPFLVIAGVAGIRALRIRRFTVIALVSIAAAVSLAMQLWAFAALYRISHGIADFEKKLSAENLPEVIVSDLFYLPEQAPRLFFNKTFFELKDEKQLPLLVEYLQKKEIGSFMLILSAHSKMRAMDNRSLGKLLNAFPVSRPPEKLQLIPGEGFEFEIFLAVCSSRGLADRQHRSSR